METPVINASSLQVFFAIRYISRYKYQAYKVYESVDSNYFSRYLY